VPDEPAELDEPAEPAEPADELDDPERLAAEDLLPDGLLDDALLAVPDDALELVPADAAAAEWVEPGSVAATAPAARTPATPTPAVTADSRFMPRRLSIDGGTGRPSGLLGIGSSFPAGWVAGVAPPGGARRLARLITTMRQPVQGYLQRGSELLLNRGALPGRRREGHDRREGFRVGAGCPPPRWRAPGVSRLDARLPAGPIAAARFRSR
jgi:hypothetical protein